MTGHFIPGAKVSTYYQLYGVTINSNILLVRTIAATTSQM